MPKKPKTYYSDDPERQALIEEYRPYFSYPHVPTGATKGIIRALLEQVATYAPALNIQAAEGHLMAELLHDNSELEKARKRSEDYSTEFQTPEENAAAEQFLADLVCEGCGSARVKKVLDEYSSHSTDRMREESDEILSFLDRNPRKNQVKTDWLNAILPNLLASLKTNFACSPRCRANSAWPPMKKDKTGKEVVDTDAIEEITGPQEGSGVASITNAILSYYHGLGTRSIERYLEGVRPKTVGRSSIPRS